MVKEKILTYAKHARRHLIDMDFHPLRDQDVEMISHLMRGCEVTKGCWKLMHIPRMRNRSQPSLLYN